MAKRLYVGNLPWSVTTESLQELFSKAGAVKDTKVMVDVATGRSRGFGFVEMETDDAAEAAITQFNDYELDGRRLTVNEARPKPEGGSGSRYGA